MNADWKGQLAIYADGELDPDRRHELERHLAADDESRRVVERWQALRNAANRVLIAEPIPAGLHERVLDRMRAAQTAHRYRTYKLLATFAAAAVIVFAVLSWPDRVAATTVPVEDFAKIYDHCAVRHGHNSYHACQASYGLLQKKLRHDVNRKVRLPNLAPHGFQISGACKCGPDKCHSVHVYYVNDTTPRRVISFFAVDRPIHLACPCDRKQVCTGRCTYQSTSVGEVVLLKWDEARTSYLLCGHVGQDELLALADAIRVSDDGVPRPSLALVDNP